MNAVIDAISRALEFLYNWVWKGFSWAHSEWWSKLLDLTAVYAKKITWFYSLAIVVLAYVTSSSGMSVGVLAAIGSDMADMAVAFRAASPQADRTLNIGFTTFGFMNYLLPVNLLFTLLSFFLIAKVTVSVVRMTVAIWQLLPFKAT